MFEVGGLGYLSHGFLCAWQVGRGLNILNIWRRLVLKHVIKSEPWEERCISCGTPVVHELTTP